jgi:methylase of polypeptide subunit release factors
VEGVDRDTGATLLRALDEAGYHFVTITPESHRRILDRREGERARDLRDIFGWSMAFGRDTLDPPLLRLLEDAGLLTREGEHLRSKVRVSSLSGRLFLHSAFPTQDEDAVFFGPDTYRFARFLEAELGDGGAVGTLVDFGAGCGAGGIVAAGLAEPEHLILLDVNPAALAMAETNAAAAGTSAETICSDNLNPVQGEIDLIIANPPFIMDSGGRGYRDGGEMLGAALSLCWAQEGMRRLSPGGRMLLYTGSAIVGGEDRLLAALAEAADEAGCTLRYEELDPDIFGEELEKPAYAEAAIERIAAVGAVISKI